MNLSMRGQSQSVQKDAHAANTGCTRMKAVTIWRADADTNSAMFVVENTKIATALELQLPAMLKLQESQQKINGLRTLVLLKKNVSEEYVKLLRIKQPYKKQVQLLK